jgi:hypothetical protein
VSVKVESGANVKAAETPVLTLPELLNAPVIVNVTVLLPLLNDRVPFAELVFPDFSYAVGTENPVAALRPEIVIVVAPPLPVKVMVCVEPVATDAGFRALLKVTEKVSLASACPGVLPPFVLVMPVTASGAVLVSEKFTDPVPVADAATL